MAQNNFLQSPFDALATATEESIYSLPPLPGQKSSTPTQVSEVPRDTRAPAVEQPEEPVAGQPVKAKPGQYLPPANLRPVFEAAAREFNVPVNVLMALGHQESRFNPAAIGPSTQWGRAKGMMQYLDSTASGLGINPFDPNQAVPAAARQLRERLDKGYSMEDAVKEHFAGPNRKLWGEKTAAYGREVMEKVGFIGEELGAGAPPAAAADPLADMNKAEPGRYRPATPEEVAAFEKKQAAMTEAERVESAAQQKKNDDRGFGERASEALSGGTDNMVQSLNTSRFVMAGGDSQLLAKALADKFAAGQERAKQKTTGEREMDASFQAVTDAEGVVDTTLAGAKAIGTAFMNPKDLAVGVIEQLPNMLPTMGAGVAGAGGGAAIGGGAGALAAGVGAIPGAITGAIVGGRAGMVAGTTATELGAEVEYMIGKRLEEAKQPPTPENIKALLDDPVFIGEARKQGLAKGLTVGLIDQLFMGLAGKVAGKTASAATKTGKVALGTGAVGLDATGEVVGEAASQQVARGEVDAGDALKEGVYGLGQSIVEPAVGATMQAAGKAAKAMRPGEAPPRVEPSAAPTATPPAAPAAQTPAAPQAPATPSGPLTAAVERAAETPAEQPPRVSVVAPEGEVTGFMESMQQDGQGGFVARVLGDDGQVYTFTSADGVSITPLAPEPAGPLTAAVEQVAAAQPEVTPVAEPVAAPIAEAAPAEPVSQPAQSGTTDAGVETTPPPQAAPALAEMDEPALRERLKYIASQGKANGWNKLLTNARREVEAEINKRTEGAKTDERADSVGVRVPDVSAGSVQADAPRGADQPAGREGDAQLRDGVQADPGPSVPADGNAVPAAGAAANRQPALTPKQSAALDRIAKGTAFFGTPEKADAFIAKNEIGDTHEVVQTGKVRFEVKANAPATAKGSSSVQADATPAILPAGGTTTADEREPEQSKKQSKVLPREMDEDGRAKDGKPINPGDVFKTLSGRETSPYPKQKSERYASEWLIENAASEAESRGDKFNSRTFRATKPNKSGGLTTADRESMLMYLFGYQPDVVPSILKPLVPSKPDTSLLPQSESQAVRDFLDGKRPDAPTLEEVAKELANTPQDQVKLRKGDWVSYALNKDGDKAIGEVVSVSGDSLKVLTDDGARITMKRGDATYVSKASAAAVPVGGTVTKDEPPEENKPAAEQAPAPAEPLISVPADNKPAEQAWSESSPADRRKMLADAGYTDGDQARVLSGTNWADLSDDVRGKIESPARKPISVTKAGSGATAIVIDPSAMSGREPDLIKQLRENGSVQAEQIEQAKTELAAGNDSLAKDLLRINAPAVNQEPIKDETPAQQGSEAAEQASDQEKFSADRVERAGGFFMDLKDVAKNGDNTQSPWLLSDGRIVGTGQDHISFADQYLPRGVVGYSDFMKETGAVRASFFNDADRGYVATLHLAKGQSLTPEQLGALKSIESQRGAPMVVLFGAADGLVNPEYTETTVSALASDQETAPASGSLVDALYGQVSSGNMPSDNNALRKMVAEIDGAPADNARLKIAQEALEAAIARRARDIVAEGGDVRQTYDKLVDLYQSQPNLNIRTSTSIENQAYSTPAPLAYVSAKLAGIDANTTVYEPTAGNGMLLITADPKNATANELEDTRFENLKAQGFDAIQGDALDVVSSGAVAAGSQDAVITNPPFGSVKDDAGKATKVSVDGYKIGKIDHLIAAEALKAMKDDGKATLIIGADKVAGGIGTDDRIFFNWLYGNYDVTSHFEADGKLYSRQGASWPVRVITINGRKKSAAVSPRPGDVKRVSTWEEVYEQYQQGLDAQINNDGGAAVSPDGAVQRGRADDAGASPVAAGAEDRADGAAKPAARARSDGNVAGERAGTVRTGAAGATERTAGDTGAQRRNEPAAVPDRLEEGSAKDRSAGGKARADRPAGDAGADRVGNEFQAAYVPRSSRKDDGVLIPVNMAQPTQDALNALEDEVGDIDEYVMRELGYPSKKALHDALMGLQVDSVASAIYQISKGKGAVIADQCVAAGTRIYDPISGEHTAIEVLAERGQPIHVLSLGPDGLVPAVASAPFRKGVSDLYRVTLDDGREITVTQNHRFLTPSGWQTLAQGLTVGSILVSAEVLPEKSSGASPSVHGEGALRSTGTPEGFQESCFSHHRQCDEQPRGAQGIGQAFLLRQGGALERIRLSSRSGGLAASAKHSHQRQSSGLHSRSSFSPLEIRGLSLTSGQSHACGAILLERTRQSAPQSGQSTELPHQQSGEVLLHQHEQRCENFVEQEFQSGEAQIELFDPEPIDGEQLIERIRQLGELRKSAEQEGREWSPCADYTGYRRIQCIQFVRRDEFFDMWVPGFENYVAEGFVNHNTGIGKGRQAAAIIRWAKRKGHLPVFVTVKPQLFTDMFNDLADIGTDDVAPLLLNADEWIANAAGEKLFTNKKSEHRKTIANIAGTGELPPGRNALFLTYSQINTENIQRTALSALAPRAVFILDESHNAGGASQTGEFVRAILGEAVGVTYLSATYAKRPDNMPVYFKTDIGMAISDDGQLTGAMSAGGLPLQTVVSHNLVKAGQMFRRERSYDGVSITTTADTARREEHEKLSDTVTLALRGIVEADRAFHNGFVEQMAQQLAKEGAALKDIAGNQASQSVNHTEFSSVVHNFVRQMLLGLKADSAADKAIEALKAGQKPLIAVENTMGSFLAEYAANSNIRQGQPLGRFDYRTVLERALERSRVIVIKDATGNDTKRKVELSELDPVTRDAYDRAQAIIRSLDLDIPVSPIDWMRNRIEQAGYRVAEITGRNLTVDYSEGAPKLSQLPTEEQNDKVGTTRKFNDGRLDAIILNVSGSTGISLHASEKFKDKRPRKMIVAQAAQDINIFMQMLGRIHRTGQVTLPSYEILSVDLPAEKRPTSILSNKMKSLNANTSSNTESATSIKSSDLLNKYGDQVVGAYLSDNDELAQALGIQDPMDSEGRVQEDLARKATGRLALMPVEVQKAFYAEVEEQYSNLIDYLNKTNQNELEPRTFDYDAKETAAQVIFEGDNPSSPFGADAIYHEYSIKAQGKPMTPDEIRAEIVESLGGKDAKQHAADIAAGLDAQFAGFTARLTTDGQMSAANIAKRKAGEFIRDHRIGSGWRVEINGDVYNAVVTNIRSTHKGAGNPFSMSKIQVTVALNGALRSVTVPATQFEGIEVAGLGAAPRIDGMFEQTPQDERQTTKIITGNLLAAYGEISTKGTIINFTKADGTTEQGILLPKVFNPAINTRGDYRMRSVADVLKFLRESEDTNIARFGVSNREGTVRVVPDGAGVALVVPKSKAKGGKFFLNKKLTDITGDFVSQGQTMRVEIPASKAADAVAVVMDMNALYALPSMAVEAKKIIGEGSGETRYSVAGSAGFFSALAQFVENAEAKSATADGWMQQIRGQVAKGNVKADEVAWTGVEEWLGTQTGKVPREAVSEFLRANGVQVQETTLGVTKTPLTARRVSDVPEGDRSQYPGSDYFEPTDWLVFRDGDWVGTYQGGAASEAQAVERYRAEAQDEGYEGVLTGGETKYGNYTLPGGENYREVLLTLPAVETKRTWEWYDPESGESAEGFATQQEAMDARPSISAVVSMVEPKGSQQDYRSSHWDQSNILAHIRLNDRTDADGKRVLFVEELQSDWAQEGKKKGFKKPEPDDFKVEVRLVGSWHPQFPETKDKWRVTVNGQDRGYIQADDENEARYKAGANETSRRDNSGKVPAAPFVDKTDKWVALALKRVIKMAVDEGYDRVAFVTGEQSAARYDLSKHIDRIHYEKSEDGLYELIAYKIGSRDDSMGSEALHEDEIDLARIEELVGKDIAQKIADEAGEKIGGSYRDWRELKNVDLKVGGEGMKAFYDRIVPSVLKDVLRKVGGGAVTTVAMQPQYGNRFKAIAFDGSVRFFSTNEAAHDWLDRQHDGEGGVEGEQTQLSQPGFDITPTMKKKAVNGLPLFSAGVGGTLTKPALRDRLTTGVIGPVVSRLIDAGVIVLHKDVSTLPKSIKAVRGMQAATDGKTVHMVASGLTADTARGALFHEFFHTGGENLIGTDQWGKLMGRLSSLQKQGQQSNGKAREFFDKARARVQAAEQRGAVTEGFAPEEFGAYAIEEYENAPATVRKWVDDLIGAVKAWALKRFGKQLGDVTPAQLSAIAKMALMDAAAERMTGRAPMMSARGLTDTPAFRRWFGSSEAVNADGSPMVLYHGTGADIAVFDPKRTTSIDGIFTTPKAGYASQVAAGAGGTPNVMPLYASIQNAARMKAADYTAANVRKAMADRAVDGVIVTDAEGNVDTVIVKRPDQLKSVFNAGGFNPGNPDVRYSVSPEEAERVIDDADKALDAAPDRLPKDDYIGRVVGDMSLGARLLVHPRTVASVHPEFTPVYMTAISQIETRDANIADLGTGAAAYSKLDEAGKTSVNRALELGRLMSETYTADQLTAGVTNKGSKTVVSVGDDGKPRTTTVPVDALLSGAGEVVKLSPEEATAYTDLRAMFDRALDKMRDQTLEELGFPELAGLKNAAREISKLALTETGDKAERLQNIAVFVAEIEQAKRAGYVPFARYGDYVVTVKEKIADLTYVEDDAKHLIVQDVPAAFAGDLLDMGAEETPEGWRIKKSQKADVERLTEKTVYSTKVETGLRDFFDERKAGKVDDIGPVRDAIEKARAEYVGDNPSRRVVAFKAREKTPDAPVVLSDVDALAEVAQIDNATWDAVRDKLADAIKAKGFRRHFFHSDNVPGYTGDFERAIADYVIGMSGYLARRSHMKKWGNSVTAIKDKPKLFEYASKYRDYVNSPQEEFAMVRQVGFFSYIAGVVASAFANLTQVPMLTLPTLSQIAPVPLVMKEVARAYKDTFKMLGRPGKVGLDMFDPDKAPADVRDALKEAWVEGSFVPLETYDLMMTARQRNVGARKGVKLFNDTTKVVALFFTFAERVNRLVTFIAAARLSEKPAVRANANRVLRNDALARREVLANWGQKSLAEWAVDETQYRMGKANRPTMMRGVGSAIMQFKGYMLQTFEAWYRMSKLHGKEGKFAMAASLVTLYALSGLWGMPGADDLRKLIENIYRQIAKKDLDLKTELRQWIAKTSGSNTLAQIVSKGVTYPAGVDLTRVGMGSVAPDSPLAAAGIPFDMLIGRPSRAFEKGSSGDPYGAVAELTPNFMKHWIVAGGWAVDGVRDKQGSRILRPEDLSDSDIGMKALGFQPSIITDVRDYEYAQRRQETAVDALKRRYTNQLAKAMAAMETESDPKELARLEERVAEVYADLDAHNETASEEQQIVIGKRALDNRIQREAEGIKSTWGKERKNARGAAEDLRGVFGLSEEDE